MSRTIRHTAPGFNLSVDLEAVPEDQKEALVRKLEEAISRLKR